MIDGTEIRNGEESYMQCGQGLPSSEPSAKSAFMHSSPGILVFSRRRQLLHMNHRALELTGCLNQTEIGSAPNIRSVSVRELSAQIQETLDYRREANIWEICELKRVIFDAERKILVRGFGLAGRNSHDDSRIVIVLEEVGLRQEQQAQPTPGFSAQSLFAGPSSKGAWAHDHIRIRAQAYALYEQRGRQEGRALEDWLNAERQVVGAVNNS
ncbi:MAG: DUF2934 domain-containing protein [Nitrospirota bacterium]|nr:DUF2934 domain-containing protein [Nitrospirota bacterium]